MIVPESGTTKRTHLAPLYHPDTLVNPDTFIVYIYYCTCAHVKFWKYRLDCEKVRRGLGDAARELANSLLQNVVDTYRKENERQVIHFTILAIIVLNG